MQCCLQQAPAPDVRCPVTYSCRRCERLCNLQRLNFTLVAVVSTDRGVERRLLQRPASWLPRGCAGAAQKQIRSFVIAKARKASSSSALADDLRDQGFPSDKTKQFAEQLMARFSQKKQASVRRSPSCSVSKKPLKLSYGVIVRILQRFTLSEADIVVASA